MTQLKECDEYVQDKATLIQVMDLMDEEQAHCDAVAMRYMHSLQDELVCSTR
jgi:hypothetical protein